MIKYPVLLRLAFLFWAAGFSLLMLREFAILNFNSLNYLILISMVSSVILVFVSVREESDE